MRIIEFATAVVCAHALQSTDPFIVNGVCPASLKQISQSKTQSRIANDGGV